MRNNGRVFIPYTIERGEKIVLSIAVDLDKLIIVGWKILKVPVYDSQHARSLVNQVQKITKSEYFTMNKGYDSENIHDYIRGT